MTPATSPDARTRDWTRRSVLRTLGLGAVALAIPRGSAGTSAAIPVAVQLYSVREDCRADFDAALAAVAAMGFAGVEFAGYYHYENRPADLRKRLDDLNLRAAGTHLRTSAFDDANMARTIDFHQAIGCRFLIVPGDPAFTDPEKSRALAELFNGTAARLKPLGMACGFHNHQSEFATDGAKTWWDLFAERTTPDVILQQDCGWTTMAGLDPAALIRKHPGRTKSTHFKPVVLPQHAQARKPLLGEDSVDWAAVYAACVEAGGTEWIVVEQEEYPDGRSPMDCTRRSLAGLRKILAGGNRRPIAARAGTRRP
ncbi:MAG: sugar phosphate isomerase/epimerase [Vicinamibacteraceae bacterium]|nr:sugar phosphate isomerase/epimerase [Vicinamibacteraceae bacterium]